MERVACGDDRVEMETLQKLNKTQYIVTVVTANDICGIHNVVVYWIHDTSFFYVLIDLHEVQDNYETVLI